MDANTKSNRRIYLASRNTHKLEELRALLEGLPIQIHLASELANDITWEETGITFSDNARIKARTLKTYTDDCVLADDSGLEVDALAGAPGVYSARYAGTNATDEENNQKLLAALSSEANRKAHFTCCLCFISEDGIETIFEGQLHGEIAHSMRGAHGFGYDSLFYLPEFHQALAELPESDKNKISHRAEAVKKFRRYMNC